MKGVEVAAGPWMPKLLLIAYDVLKSRAPFDAS
jgi:hypothetical protein